MKKYLVTYSVCGTMTIEANSEDEAREKAKVLSPKEILNEVEIALMGDSYEVGTIEGYDE